MAADLDVLKEIPGYHAILKAVLKSQIQMLVEQLSDQTNEETVVLTASVNDGTLYHLGSSSGKMFLEDREDFKSQFLGFCLKRHHRKSCLENDSRPAPEGPERRARNTSNRFSPIPISSGPLSYGSNQKVGGGRTVGSVSHRPVPHPSTSSPSLSSSFQQQHQEQPGFQESSYLVSQEQSDTMKAEPPSGVSGVMAGSESLVQGAGHVAQDNSGAHGSNESTSVNIKAEPEDDFEITGVELTGDGDGQSDFDQSQWAGNMSSDAMAYLPSTSMAEGSFDAGDQSFSNSTFTGYHGDNSSGFNNMGHPLSGHGMAEGTFQFNSCNFCEKTFMTKSGLNQHIKTVHACEKHRQCRYCPKSFAKKIDVIRHERCHTGERPFKCNICGKAFTQKVHMKSHQMVHLKSID